MYESSRYTFYRKIKFMEYVNHNISMCITLQRGLGYHIVCSLNINYGLFILEYLIKIKHPQTGDLNALYQNFR